MPVQERIALHVCALNGKSSMISQMVSKFLGWKLPSDFAPDCGITFRSESEYDHPEFGRSKFEPVGTNLLTADQATAMFEFCIKDELLQLDAQRVYMLAALKLARPLVAAWPQHRDLALVAIDAAIVVAEIPILEIKEDAHAS